MFSDLSDRYLRICNFVVVVCHLYPVSRIIRMPYALWPYVVCRICVYAYVWVSADSQAVNIQYEHVVQSEPNDYCRRFIKDADLEADHQFRQVQDHE